MGPRVESTPIGACGDCAAFLIPFATQTCLVLVSRSLLPCPLPSSSRMYVMDKYNLHSDPCDRQVRNWALLLLLCLCWVGYGTGLYCCLALVAVLPLLGWLRNWALLLLLCLCWVGCVPDPN
jgi:hypothetical protein